MPYLLAMNQLPVLIAPADTMHTDQMISFDPESTVDVTGAQMNQYDAHISLRMPLGIGKLVASVFHSEIFKTQVVVETYNWQNGTD